MAQMVEALCCKRRGAASIPDGVIGICHNPSGRTMALGSTQPPTDFRNISWGGGKGGRIVGLTTLPSSCADCLGI
jgi:hypothetical protein